MVLLVLRLFILSYIENINSKTNRMTQDEGSRLKSRDLLRCILGSIRRYFASSLCIQCLIVPILPRMRVIWSSLNKLFVWYENASFYAVLGGFRHLYFALVAWNSKIMINASILFKMRVKQNWYNEPFVRYEKCVFLGGFLGGFRRPNYYIGCLKFENHDKGTHSV